MDVLTDDTCEPAKNEDSGQSNSVAEVDNLSDGVIEINIDGDERDDDDYQTNGKHDSVDPDDEPFQWSDKPVLATTQLFKTFVNMAKERVSLKKQHETENNYQNGNTNGFKDGVGRSGRKQVAKKSTQNPPRLLTTYGNKSEALRTNGNKESTAVEDDVITQKENNENDCQNIDLTDDIKVTEDKPNEDQLNDPIIDESSESGLPSKLPRLEVLSRFNRSDDILIKSIDDSSNTSAPEIGRKTKPEDSDSLLNRSKSLQDISESSNVIVEENTDKNDDVSKEPTHSQIVIEELENILRAFENNEPEVIEMEAINSDDKEILVQIVDETSKEYSKESVELMKEDADYSNLSSNSTNKETSKLNKSANVSSEQAIKTGTVVLEELQSFDCSTNFESEMDIDCVVTIEEDSCDVSKQEELKIITKKSGSSLESLPKSDADISNQEDSKSKCDKTLSELLEESLEMEVDQESKPVPSSDTIKLAESSDNTRDSKEDNQSFSMLSGDNQDPVADGEDDKEAMRLKLIDETLENNSITIKNATSSSDLGEIELTFDKKKKVEVPQPSHVPNFVQTQQSKSLIELIEGENKPVAVQSFEDDDLVLIFHSTTSTSNKSNQKSNKKETNQVKEIEKEPTIDEEKDSIEKSKKV